MMKPGKASDARLDHGPTLRKSPSYFVWRRVRSHGRLPSPKPEGTCFQLHCASAKIRIRSFVDSLRFVQTAGSSISGTRCLQIGMATRRFSGMSIEQLPEWILQWSCHGSHSGRTLRAVPSMLSRSSDEECDRRTNGPKELGFTGALARHNGSVHVHRLIARGYTASAGSKLCT
jgi:hypothetical protein